jgi:hypothetical protein
VDRTRTARVASFFVRYQWVFWVGQIVLWTLTWLYWSVGFAQTKPSERIANLENRVTHVETRGDTMMSILRGLAIDACQRLHDNYYARRQLGCDERGQ